MTFEEAALKFSDDPGKINGASMVNQSTGNTRFLEDQLDPKVFFSISKLQVGEISRPVAMLNEESKQTLNLYYLKSKSEPHKANLRDDYSTIMEWAMNKKRGDTINKWISEKIAKTYFRINDSYLNCKFKHTWELK